MVYKNKQNDLITDLDKINYYNKKIKENISTCRKISICFLVICVFAFLFDSVTGGVLPLILLSTFFIWRIIMFFIKYEYSNKIILNAGDNCIVECKECKNYKYTNKKCDNCGNDSSLTNDEIVKKLNFYKKRRRIIILLCFIIVTLIVIGEIKIILSVYENNNYALSVYLFTFGNPSIFFAFLIVTGLIICFFVILGFNNISNNFYLKEILLRKDNFKITDKDTKQ